MVRRRAETQEGANDGAAGADDGAGAGGDGGAGGAGGAGDTGGGAGGAGGAGGESGGGGDPVGADLEGRIRGWVREAVAELVDAGPGRGGGRARPADEEHATRAQVRAALDELRGEEERDSKLREMEEQLKRVTERPPSRSGWLGKVQRAMWGEE